MKIEALDAHCQAQDKNIATVKADRADIVCKGYNKDILINEAVILLNKARGE